MFEIKLGSDLIAKDVNINVLYGDFVFNTGKSSFKLGDIKQNQKKESPIFFFCHERSTKKAANKL